MVSEAAVRRLAQMLVDEPKMFAQEWFERARDMGAVLPPQWVATIFDAVTPAAREAYVEVFGERLTWLATLDPRWHARTLGVEPTEEGWATGALEERATMLRRLRATDPVRGRTWLESTWATDSPEAREKFIQLVVIGLHSGDEPFLEAALDDKRKPVRVLAAEYLARLPESDYVDRSRARLASLFVLAEKPTGLLSRFSSRKLRVELPTELDKPALRDMIETKPPAHRKLGERAFWLMQWLAAVPPTAWCREFDCTAAELLSAALATDYGDELLSALSAAAIRHPNAEFIDAACAAWRQCAAKPDSHAVSGDSLARLILALPPLERSPQLLKQVAAYHAEGANEAAYDLLGRLEMRWPPDVTTTAFRILEAKIRTEGSSYAQSRLTMDAWARRADAAAAVPLLAGLLERTSAESACYPGLKRLQELLDFRLEMYKELRL
jgi:hypothetical protein